MIIIVDFNKLSDLLTDKFFKMELKLLRNARKVQEIIINSTDENFKLIH